MAINSFPGSSGGGLPGHNFIDQIYVSSRVRRWVRAGSPGYYRALSGLGEANGFIFFVQSDSTIVQAPLGGVAEVTLPFTEIRILTAAQDLISLYKVAAKTTDSLTLSPNYTTITSTGLYTFPTNAVGFCDALLVGGGGGAYHHGGGGGGGGIVEISSIPLKVSGTFSVQVGTAGATQSNGGDTVFLNHTAKGGGGATGDSGNGKNGPTGGGGTCSSSSGNFAGGTGDGNIPQLVSDKSRDSWLASVGTSLSVPLPMQDAVIRFTGSSWNGGSINGSGHTGGGGAGATGNGTNGSGTTPGQGGPGISIAWGNIPAKFYSAGGGGSNHNNQNNGPGGGTGWNNSAGHYGMGGDSEFNSVQSPTGGVVYIKTWSV